LLHCPRSGTSLALRVSASVPPQRSNGLIDPALATAAGAQCVARNQRPSRLVKWLRWIIVSQSEMIMNTIVPHLLVDHPEPTLTP